MQYHQTTSIRAWLPFYIITLVTMVILFILLTIAVVGFSLIVFHLTNEGR